MDFERLSGSDGQYLEARNYIRRGICFSCEPGITSDYKIAMAFGGLATPPLTFNGSLHKKNVHLSRFRHSSVNLSK